MDTKAILEFSEVTLRSETHHAADVTRMEFALMPGQMAMVLLGVHSRYVPLCDLAEGLVEPQEGHVAFMGARWDGMPAERQAAWRGSIGRVFEGQGWVSNLSVYDNVVLSQRHHTDRKEDDLRREAERLALDAGLSALPDSPPDAVLVSDLKRAEWVRAFLGGPRLVLLERPEQGMPDDAVSRLVGLALTAAGAGAAMLWMTPRRDIWADKRLTMARRFSMEDGAWVADSGG
jgi:phospholipid/cholesterol/gamma-HCH transport system ATP-binding protein